MGETLRNAKLLYKTHGILNKQKDNAILFAHMWSGTSSSMEGFIGKGRPLDPEKYFIICPNNLGSCYGTTFENRNPELTLISTRDISRSHLLLMQHLGIESVFMLIGGSQGGQIALEIAYSQKERIKNLVLLATNARHSSWGIAFNEAQRMCIESNSEEGLKAARAIAMLSYRNYEMYSRTEKVEDYDKISDYGAAAYQRYQAEKLKKRFDSRSYLILSRAMDSHNLGRGRGELGQVLNRIGTKTLIIGISSDILFPISELQFLAKHLPDSLLSIIDSAYGHDGFLTESIKINKIIRAFLNSD
jgi:homoserine O-acetyltransferase